MDIQRRSEMGKWLGAAASSSALILWCVFVYANRFYPETVNEGTWTVQKLMLLLSAAGILTALAKKPFLMFLVFLASFFPIGLYLLGVPGWARLIGIADLLFAFSIVLLLSARYRFVKI